MKETFIQIKFDKKTALSIKEPLANSYGFDLTDENAIGYSIGNLKFTVLGFRATTQYDTLVATVKVSLLPHIHDEYTHVQKINLYDQDRINGYSRTGAFHLNVTQEEIKKGVCSLRERLEKFRLDEIRNGQSQVKKTILSGQEQKDALEILKADNLTECIEGLLKKAGLVTEVENGLKLFLILLSRNFDAPLHALLQGSPQLTRLLMDTVVSTLPEDQVHELTSMSASSMYYSRNKEFWKNKVLYVTGIDKYFKGASTIKEFLENKILKRHTTESDHLTRQLYASDKVVPGPICLLGFSEDDSINNRFFQECFFIRVEETEKNKAEMLEYLKKDSCGLIDMESQQEAKRVLIAIQDKVKPVKVIIPFADKLQLPNTVFQELRSFSQLITFIKAVALLHQHQLKKKKDKNGMEYIEANTDHLEIAIGLFKSIAVSKSDILSPGQRNFLESLKMHVKDKDASFKVPELMKVLQMKKSSFYNVLNDLKEIGYISDCGGDKKGGILYKVTDWDDYKDLQKSVTILDEQLKKMKAEDSTKFPPGFHEVSTDKKRHKK